MKDKSDGVSIIWVFVIVIIAYVCLTILTYMHKYGTI